MSVNSEKQNVNIINLAHCKVLDAESEPIQVGKLWQKQTAILVFLRHFGCIACRAHAEQVCENRQSLEGSGGKIYFIGNGQPSAIQGFKEQTGIKDIPIYTDPSLESFYSAGFHRGFFKAHNFKAIKNAVGLMKEGHRQGTVSKENGNISQLGGVLVVHQDGKVPYHYISETLGDIPPDEEMAQVPWISS